MSGIEKTYKMKRSYKVEITEISDEVVISGHDWKLGGSIESMGDYGYTPQIEKIKEVERVVYFQRLENLDIGKVIMSVLTSRKD